MGFRGTKNRIFIQFWILFFLAMLFIDVLMVFIFLERTLSRYIEQKKSSLMIACENIGRFHGNDQKTGLLKKKTVFPEGDRFFYVETVRNSGR
jgi:uncharacterized membrane protein